MGYFQPSVLRLGALGFGLLSWVDLHQAIESVKGHWLHFVFVGDFVQGQTFPGDSGIDPGPEVGVFLDNVPLVPIDIFVLPGLGALSEPFYLLPLNFGDEPVVLLGLADFDFLDALGVLLLDVLLALDETLLDEFEALCVLLLLLVLLLAPLAELLLLEELAADVEAGLVGDGRQAVLEPLLFAVEFDLVQFFDARREACSYANAYPSRTSGS